MKNIILVPFILGAIFPAVFALSFIQNGTLELGSVYCTAHPGSHNAKVVKMSHNESLTLTYNGYHTSGGYCSVIFTREPEVRRRDHSWRLCAKPLEFNIADCSVVVDYTPFYIITIFPENEKSCSSSENATLKEQCTTDVNLRIGIETTKNTNSSMVWLITAVNLNYTEPVTTTSTTTVGTPSKASVMPHFCGPLVLFGFIFTWISQSS